HVYIRIEQTDTPMTCAASRGQILKVPIAHNDGNYTADESTIAELEKNHQVLFRYTTPDGADDNGGNPNDSVHNIARGSNCGRRPPRAPSHRRWTALTDSSSSNPSPTPLWAPQRPPLDPGRAARVLCSGAACCASRGQGITKWPQLLPRSKSLLKLLPNMV